MADSFISIQGNVTQNPELRFTGTGKGVASFSVAVNRSFQRNGQWEKETTFWNVVAWDSLGENAASSLSKGDRVSVTGRPQERRFERKDGSEGRVVEVVADDIAVSLKWATAEVSRNSKSGGGFAAAGQPSQSAAAVNAIKDAFPGASSAPIDEPF